MKILVVSLLRQGDLIMQETLLRQLSSQNPDAEVHLLVNEEMQNAAKLISNIAKIQLFPRKLLQVLMVEPTFSQARAFDELSKWIQELNQFDYDQIYNVTHNELSARLMDLLSAERSIGVRYENGTRTPLDNSWLEYFNDHWSENQFPSFHYSDVLAKAMELKPSALKNPIAQNVHNHIAIQPLTSDSKKNWPLENYKELIYGLRQAGFEQKISILASQKDEKLIESVFGDLRNVEIDFSDFENLKVVFKSCDLMITPDTSVQHLAAACGVRCVSLFLGSANPFKTGPHIGESFVVTSRQPCYPCKHSEACHRESHACAEDISVESVTRVVTAALKKQTELPFFERMQIWTTHRGWTENYFLQNPHSSLRAKVSGRIQQVVWQFYLDGENDYQGAAKYLTETFIENNSQKNILSIIAGGLCDQAENEIEIAKQLRSHKDLRDPHSVITHGDYWQKAVSEARELLGIEVNIIKALMKELDQGGRNVQGTRGASEARADEARKIGPADIQNEGL